MTESVTAPAARGMKATGKNAFWLVGERVGHLGVAFVVSFVVAAKLGSANYGQITLGLSLLSLLLPISNIVAQCLLRDTAAEPEATISLYSAAVIVTGIVSAVIVLLVGVGVALTLGLGSDAGVVTMVMVGSSLLRPLNTADAWFLQRLNSKRTVKIRVAVLVVVGAARIALPLMGFSVVALAWTYMVEAFLASLGMWIAFRRSCREYRWEFSQPRIWTLTKEFTPLFIASSSALVFMKLDQIMLVWLSTFSEAGTFGLGSSLAETPRFPLVALMASLAPRLLALKNRDPEVYWARLADVSRLVTLLGYGLTVGLIFVVAPIAPYLLPAGDYQSIRTVIVLMALTTPIVCVGGILLWITNWERLYREAMMRNIAAAVISVSLNFYLLPRYGAVGAAITTLVATLWVFVIGALVAKRTRRVILMTLPSLEPITSTRTLIRHRKETRAERREMHALAAELSSGNPDSS